MLIGLILIVGSGSYLWYQTRTPQPPPLALAGIDPAIVAVVEQARAAALAAPRSASAWGRLGMVLAAHDFTAEANVCFTQAETLDPREPRWPYYQGVALARGDPEAALPKLQQAVALCGDTPEAPRQRLAELLLGQGYFDEAEAQFRRVLQHQEAHPRAQLGLGQLAYRAGKLDDSLLHLNRCKGDPRTQKIACILLAEIHQRRGDSRAAEEARRQAAALPEALAWPDPFVEEVSQLRTGKQVRLELADKRIRQNRVSEAIPLLQQTLRDYPDSDWGWYLLGKALLRQENWAAAEQTLRRAVQLTPEAAEIQFHLGVALFQQKDHGAAAACFRRAAELKPDYELAHYNLGQCLDLQGDRAAAIECLRTALRCQPSLSEARLTLADWLLQQDQPAEALRLLRPALEVHPQDTRLKQLVQRLSKHILVPVVP